MHAWNLYVLHKLNFTFYPSTLSSQCSTWWIRQHVLLLLTSSFQFGMWIEMENYLRWWYWLLWAKQSHRVDAFELLNWTHNSSSEIFILLCRFLESSILTTFIMRVNVWWMIVMMNDRHTIFCIMKGECMSTLKKREVFAFCLRVF